jgi:ABC-type branched-subunit amino acid transport system ATPase component
MTPVLETFGLSVQYGGLHAVDGVDLVVEPGRLVGLIGPNGAGKTTFIDAITDSCRVGAVSWSVVVTSRTTRPTRAHAPGSAAPGSRWSCSTI